MGVSPDGPRPPGALAAVVWRTGASGHGSGPAPGGGNEGLNADARPTPPSPALRDPPHVQPLTPQGPHHTHRLRKSQGRRLLPTAPQRPHTAPLPSKGEIPFGLLIPKAPQDPPPRTRTAPTATSASALRLNPGATSARSPAYVPAHFPPPSASPVRVPLRAEGMMGAGGGEMVWRRSVPWEPPERCPETSLSTPKASPEHPRDSPEHSLEESSQSITPAIPGASCERPRGLPPSSIPRASLKHPPAHPSETTPGHPTNSLQSISLKRPTEHPENAI